MPNTTPRHKKILLRLLKTTIALAAWAFVVYKLYTVDDFAYLLDNQIVMSPNDVCILVVVLILALLNWSLEVLKWKNAVALCEPLPASTATKAVLSGVAVGSLTPNRIGEFGGRLLFIKPCNRKAATFLTFFCDISQLLATLLFGCVGAAMLTSFLTSGLKTTMLLTAIVLIIALLLLFFNYPAVVAKLLNIKWLRRFFTRNDLSFVIPTRVKIATLLLSLCRYMVFCVQLYLLLRFCGVDIALYNAFGAIFAMYLASTIIPSVFVVELGVRISFSLLFLGFFVENTVGITLATSLIYLINVAIPVLIGGIFIMTKK